MEIRLKFLKEIPQAAQPRFAQQTIQILQHLPNSLTVIININKLSHSTNCYNEDFIEMLIDQHQLLLHSFLSSHTAAATFSEIYDFDHPTFRKSLAL